MSEKKSSAARSVGAKRDTAAKIVNFLNIDGINVSLGDIRKSEFASVEDPAASVKALVAWAKEINKILRGS